MVVQSLLKARQWFVANDPPKSQITICTCMQSGSNQQSPSPNMVFVNKTHGYVFWVGTSNVTYYNKTSNGGSTWTVGNLTNINAPGNSSNVAIWYEQWSQNQTGNKIHIVSQDSILGTTSYSYLFANNNTLRGSWTTIATGTNYIPGTSGRSSITESVNGTLFTAFSANVTGIHNIHVYGSTDDGSNWVPTLQNFTDTAFDDQPQLIALTGQPNGKNRIMMIYDDASTTDIGTKIYNGSTWLPTLQQLVASSNNVLFDDKFGGFNLSKYW